MLHSLPAPLIKKELFNCRVFILIDIYESIGCRTHLNSCNVSCSDYCIKCEVELKIREAKYSRILHTKV